METGVKFTRYAVLLFVRGKPEIRWFNVPSPGFPRLLRPNTLCGIVSWAYPQTEWSSGWRPVTHRYQKPWDHERPVRVPALEPKRAFRWRERQWLHQNRQEGVE